MPLDRAWPRRIEEKGRQKNGLTPAAETRLVERRMIPNILLIETDTEIITQYSTEPGTVVEIGRKARPIGAGSPSKAPMIIGGRIIYRMEFFAVPSITEEMARNQSKKARKLIAEFRSKTSGLTKRPTMHQILIDRKTMTRMHEVLEKDEAGLWATVHRHWDKIKKKGHESD